MNNALRRIGRLRKQMDNLEERLRIYNRNINLQIHLAGKVQALDAMELRGVDESEQRWWRDEGRAKTSSRP